MSIDRATPLPGNVPQHKQQAAYVQKDAVIAAHHAAELIVVAHIPPAGARPGFGKRARWMLAAKERHSPRHAVGARKMVQTEPTNGSASRRSASMVRGTSPQSPNVP